MDKHIKIDENIWKKLRVAAIIDETNIKALATKFIMVGLKKRFYSNKSVLRDLGRITEIRNKKTKKT